VQSTIALLGTITGSQNGFVLMEISLFDSMIDANDILPNNTACANIKVPAI
jgi:hypothetical protein